MNNLDKKYTDLLQDILDNGVTKQDRTGTGTISVFGRQIRHKMSEGFPLLTTKKMPFKTIVTELLWFLRGDTNIKFLVDNGCNIWNGDCYKAYTKKGANNELVRGNRLDYLIESSDVSRSTRMYTPEEFINKIKTDNEFANKWGELGPIYGKQWRQWGIKPTWNPETGEMFIGNMWIDQIQNSINLLKTDPDSRRNRVSAWNVGELDSMVLPPCHTDFQFYTREMSVKERKKYDKYFDDLIGERTEHHDTLDKRGVPRRAISLMWNQRSVDTFLGLPFNIASYGLLLEILAKEVNMVPDELIGNLGDVHLYSNHIEQAKEQIGREFTEEEILEHLQQSGMDALKDEPRMEYIAKLYKRTRQPFPLPKLNINTEFWPTQGGSCGEGPLDATAIFEGFKNDDFCRCLLEEDIQLSNYQSHSTIKAPLSN